MSQADGRDEGGVEIRLKGLLSKSEAPSSDSDVKAVHGVNFEFPLIQYYFEQLP